MADSVRVDTEVVRSAARQADAAGGDRNAGLGSGAAERIGHGVGGGEHPFHRASDLGAQIHRDGQRDGTPVRGEARCQRRRL